MGRAERIAALVAWTILAAFLFMGFGMVLGEAVALTAHGLGLVGRARLDLVVYVVRALAGAGMLGISRLYRMTAERENAGSLAAWLAGWALLLYTLAGAATLVDEQAAPAVLVMVLFGWVLVRITRYFARADVDPEPADGRPHRALGDDGRRGAPELGDECAEADGTGRYGDLGGARDTECGGRDE